MFLVFVCLFGPKAVHTRSSFFLSFHVTFNNLYHPPSLSVPPSLRDHLHESLLPKKKDTMSLISKVRKETENNPLHDMQCTYIASDYTKADSLGLECSNSSGKMLYEVNSPQATVSENIILVAVTLINSLVAVTLINNISTFYGVDKQPCIMLTCKN